LEIKVASDDIAKFEVDAIIVNFFEGAERPEGDTEILADALGYATKQGTKRIVDVATLTEVCRVAGPTMAG